LSAVNRGGRRPGSTRRRAEAVEEDRLSPCAARSARARRRRPLDPEGRAFDYRTEFQRDRDRILHSRAFRRLADKGPLAGGDPHRTRLSHALETSQLGRTIARALDLNEDLVEAISLAHDLGRPPMGDAGLEAMASLLGGGIVVQGFSPGALGEVGGFDVPAQGLRVVDLLEKRYEHPGINLTDEVRAGVWKQRDPCRGEGYPDEDREGLEPGAAASPEAQTARIACRIALGALSLDDRLANGTVALERVERLGLIRELMRKLGDRYGRGGLFMRRNRLHRGLTHLLVTGVIRRSGEVLRRWTERERVGDPARFLERRGALPADVVDLPDRLADLLAELEGVLESGTATRREAALERWRARGMIHGLFQAYHADPATLEDYVLLRFREAEGLRFLRDVPPGEQAQEIDRHYRGSRFLARTIADHLAGMTDRYLVDEHRRLCVQG
jgi:dGTPase